MERKREHRSIDDVIRDTKKRLGEPVAYRWRIEEYRPAHSSYGYDGQDYDEELVEASIWFDTEELAQAMYDVCMPNEGNVLRLRKQTAYDRVDRIWI